MTRPYITKCKPITGTATLKRTGAPCELMQLGLDEQTGSPCFAISADGSWPFIVWPDELENANWKRIKEQA